MSVLATDTRRSGHVRGGLSMAALRRVLTGAQTLDNALTANGTRSEQHIVYDRLPSETSLGFIPYPQQPQEIIVARLPFTAPYVPVVWLGVSGEDWDPNPQLFSRKLLLSYDAIVLEADWLTHLLNLATTLKRPKTQKDGIDRIQLAIGAAWERWERKPMTWPARCEDLLRLTGKKFVPNSLLIKCLRLGLIYGDNNAV